MSSLMVEVMVDGEAVRVREGSSVAVAILGAATGDSGAWAPLCGMGVCWGCHAMIDGEPDRRSCLVSVAPGMKIRTDRLDV